MPLDFDIIGKGIYSPRQAARLIGGNPQEILRWTRGSGPTEPLWNAYYQSIDDTTELSFADLVEVRVVKALRRATNSLQSIRFAISYAKEQLGIERPLSSVGFKTDGVEILMDAMEEDGELLSLSSKRPGQKVFRQLIDQSLRDLEYEDGIAARWRPEKSKKVVIDPNRQFGAPLLDEQGISTNTLYEENKIFGDPRYLSSIYEISLKTVNLAIRYEASLDGEDGKSSI